MNCYCGVKICYWPTDTTRGIILDLNKAFDKMNHNGLYIKLMKRLVPNAMCS